MIFSLSWRNIWRNRSRTVITLLSVAFAVFLSILMHSMQDGVFGHMVNNVVRFYTGYLQIHQNGYWKEQMLDNGFEWTDHLKSKLLSHDEVTALVPRLECFMLVSSHNRTKGCFIVGTNPAREDELTQLQSKLVSGSYIKENDTAVLLGEGLATNLNVQVGDSIVFMGQGMHGSMAAFKACIKGLLHFGSPEQNAQFVYTPLQYLQYQLNAENYVTSVSIDMANKKNMLKLQKELQAIAGPDYECMNWQELLPDIHGHIQADKNSAAIFTGVLYLIISFGIFGTLLMMLAERQREFGIMLSLGMHKHTMAWSLMLEVMLIGFLGVITGIILSLPLTFYFTQHPIKLGGKIAEVYEDFGFEAILPASVAPEIFIQQAIIVMIITLVLSLYPLFHVQRLDPIKAYRSK